MRRLRAMLILMLLALTNACGQPGTMTPTGALAERPTAYQLPPPATAAGQASAAPTTLSPTAPSAPSSTPPASASPVADATYMAADQHRPDTITIDVPKAGTTIDSPLTLSGSTNFWPFEATLGAMLKDAQGNLLAQIPVMVHSPDVGQGGPWSEHLTFTAPAQAQEGTLEVFDASAKDGSITSIARVKVRLVPAPAPGTTLQLDQPQPDATVTLPLHVAFSGARGDEELTLRLLPAGAPALETKVRAKLGFVVTTMQGSSPSGPAALEVARGDGRVLVRRAVRVATPEQTQPVKLAWVAQGQENLVLEERRVPRTPQIATAALNELLWGPAPGSRLGTALPTAADVLSYGGREAGWGARVRLLKLTIGDGVALANFSPELRAYGGGSARVAMIRKQIEATLLQFPSVKRVVIAVDGQTEGVLEP